MDTTSSSREGHSDLNVSTRSIAQSLHPKDIAIRLPLSPHTTLHIQLTRLDKSTLIFLTTTDPSASSSISALGSFVYAMPNHARPAEVLSTALYSIPGSIDFATRMAKIVARKSEKPTYVGCSVSFAGSIVEEEIDAVKSAVDAIMEELGGEEGPAKVNGV